jgi:hypothetical protein
MQHRRPTSLNDTRPSPQAPRASPIPRTKNLCSYPLVERDSLLRRDRATRSRVCLRLRSHSIQPGLCNAAGAGCTATVGGVALRARRSTSSQRAITSGRRVARRTLVVSAKRSVLSTLTAVGALGRVLINRHLRCGLLNVRALHPTATEQRTLRKVRVLPISDIPALAAMGPTNDIVFLGPSRYAHLRSICLTRH